ncbi:UBX domain protein [Oesophagostomum dentatum]|uniref:NADH dehydrogenase [ubiquinone] 1 alpha subcomplex subunit 12 n=1 Tax=Oesophagostomum dentatum TaxID=61180 RepID=A0A0B1TNV2_OESDE|nr:UBX domain protein [Oesophagostomum dentatum]
MRRKDGLYEPPKLKPFQGTGVRLGAVVPQVVSSSATSSSSKAAPAPPAKDFLDSPDPDENVAKAQADVNLDTNSPVTQVQIRLPNGQRVSGRFNHSHTVFAVRNFLATAHPDMAATEFQLMTTFPNKQLNLQMSLKEWLGIDKMQKLARMIKQMGGVRAALKKRYLMDVTRVGTCVGSDKFGNKYYEDNSFFMPRNRWVEYPDKVWLDYDPSQVPPEWHRWLHHITDDPPSKKPLPTEKWGLQHEENLSIFEDKKYIPYSTTRPKIIGWVPGQKK